MTHSIYSVHSRRDVLKWLKNGALMLPFTSLAGCGDLESNGDGASSLALSPPSRMMEEPPPNLGLMADSTIPRLGGDPSVAWWMRGNYAPIDYEAEVFNLEVIGSIPSELNGSLIRNGSNPSSEEPLFWFFGDGMLHKIELGDGEAMAYKSAWTQTPALEGMMSGIGAGRANTSLIVHADKLLALYEVSPPFEIDPETLASRGYYDYDGALTVPMCAHPKIDPLTGEMWFIGVDMLPPKLSCVSINARGQLLSSQSMALDAMRFMHDFQLTTNYVVIMDFPMLIDPAIITGGNMFKWSPERGARIGVMPRTGTFDDLRWFEVELAYSFHTFNAYEDGDELILEACRVVPQSSEDLFMTSELPQPWRWSLNMANGAVREAQIDDRFTDFPMIDLRLQGQEHRYNYGLTLAHKSEDYPMHPKGIFKYDRREGLMEEWSLGEAIQPDEALFVPASSEAGEDEGWLLSVIYNRMTDQSELVILDAQSVTAGPIARVLIPQRIPFGFHGAWVPREG